MLWILFYLAEAYEVSPQLLWSRGIARSCDVFPQSFQINQQGHEVGLFDWDSFKLEGEPQILYVPSMDMVKFLPRLQDAPPSARFTLVTGQEDVGVPCELFRFTSFARPEFYSIHPSAPTFQARRWSLLPENLTKLLADKRLLHWFTQNYDATDCLEGDALKKITAMPLGLDFHTKSEKDVEVVPVELQERQLKAAQKAVAPFRARYMELLFPVDCHSSYWWLPPRGSYWWQPSGQACGHRRCACQALGTAWQPVPWPRFLQLLGIVAFVAAPWGHGLDTHRFWEVLMMGSVPVVLSSPLDVLYKQFPVIILQSWQEAQPNATWHWRRQILRGWGREPVSDEVKLRLTTKFWAELIRAKHKELRS